MLFKKKIPVLYVILSTLAGSAITLFAFTSIENATSRKTKNADTQAVGDQSQNSNSRSYNIRRLSGYTYTHPVLETEPTTQSPKYNTLETSILSLIEQEKASNGLSTASVYLIDFSENEWMDVNEKETYRPGSLFKVNNLISYLRLAESKPGILDEEVLFPVNEKGTPPTQTFNSKTIEPGRKYKVRELLHYMIAYSDNNATMLLHHYMDINLFQKTFSDLGIKMPDVHDVNYEMSVKEYSKFLRVLYDGGYLTTPASEYAISLLAECDFNYGITRDLPLTLKVAHKFGEA